MKIVKNAFVVGGLTLLSRIFGFFRDIAIAVKIGASPISDAFFVAFKLPNFLRSMFGEGAFNSAFVPIFSSILVEQGDEKAMEFAKKVQSLLLIILLSITGLAIIFMPAFIVLIAPGFIGNEGQFQLAVSLSRITFPYLPLICLVAMYGGILNSVGRFAAMASAPILLNICMIFSLFAFQDFVPSIGHALSYGVILAGFAEVFWMLYFAKKAGLIIGFALPKIDTETKFLMKKMVPGIIGSSASQINLWIDTMIATLVTSGVSYLYYADRVNQFPLAIIGTAMGTVLLPTLSKLMKKQAKEEANDLQNRAIEFCLLITLPSAFGLWLLSIPIISALFERGEFTHIETIAVSGALSAYAFGLPAFVMMKVFTPSFYAVHDTKTPVKVLLFCIVINTIISLSLLKYFSHVGIAFASTVSAWLNLTTLYFIAKKRSLYKIDKRLANKVLKIICATLIMSFAIYVTNTLLAFYNLSFHIWLELILKITVAVLVYSISCIALKILTLSELKASLKRKK